MHIPIRRTNKRQESGRRGLPNARAGRTRARKEVAGRRRDRYARHPSGTYNRAALNLQKRGGSTLLSRGAERREARRGGGAGIRGAKGSRYNSQWVRRTGAKIKRHPNGELPTSITDVKRRVLKVRSLRAAAHHSPCVRLSSSSSPLPKHVPRGNLALLSF